MLLLGTKNMKTVPGWHKQHLEILLQQARDSGISGGGILRRKSRKGAKHNRRKSRKGAKGKRNYRKSNKARSRRR